jgi:hypothetical protein
LTPSDVRSQVDLEKAAIIRRAEGRQLAAELRKRAKAEILADALTAAVLQLPPLDPVRYDPPPSGKFGEEHAVLVLSDCHIGLRLTEDQAGGLWSYDYGRFREYLRRLERKLHQIVPRHNYRLPVLHIHFLGDIIEGELIYKGQQGQVDLRITQQILAALDQFTWFIRQCLTMFERVECVGVTGNHGRMGMKGELDPMDSYDALAYHFLRVRFENEPRVTWTIPEAPWYVDSIYGWSSCLLHGDVITSWMNIPYYGIERHSGRLATLYADLRRIRLDVIEMGHVHQLAFLPMGNSGACFVNGSWPGGTHLSIHRMAKANQPSQWFFGVSADRPVTWQYALSLAKDVAA